jgi:hypothetical protein
MAIAARALLRRNPMHASFPIGALGAVLVFGCGAGAASTPAISDAAPRGEMGSTSVPGASASDDPTVPGTPEPEPVPVPQGDLPEPEARGVAMVPSEAWAQVAALGIRPDLRLSQIPSKQKRKLMPRFQEALGYDDCNGCHVEGSFKKETPQMRVAREMYDHFVVALRAEGGEPLFCDSCHQGGVELVPRGDVAATKRFMKTQYTERLVRADGAEHGCASCHGEPFEPHLVERWRGAP